jgi:hypothetical protein
MRGLLVERLRPFALVAFGASAVFHLALVVAAICALLLLHHLPIIGIVILPGALILYATDCVRGNALASAGRAVDRDLVPAAIANSLDALRDIRLLRTFRACSRCWTGPARSSISLPSRGFIRCSV